MFGLTIVLAAHITQIMDIEEDSDYILDLKTWLETSAGQFKGGYSYFDVKVLAQRFICVFT